MLQLNAFWHLLGTTVFAKEGTEPIHLSAEESPFIVIPLPHSCPDGPPFENNSVKTVMGQPLAF